MDVDVSLDYGLTLLAALLIGTGFVLQQHAAQREPDSKFLSLRLIADLLRQPRWLAGIGLLLVAILALPYLVWVVWGPADLVHVGSFWYPRDFTVYLAAMQQGAIG